MKISDPEKTISCINALKVIFCMIIIAGHRREFFMYSQPAIYEQNLSFGGDGILRALDIYYHSVDVFLVCTGVLVIQSIMKLYGRWVGNQGNIFYNF